MESVLQLQAGLQAALAAVQADADDLRAQVRGYPLVGAVNAQLDCWLVGWLVG